MGNVETTTKFSRLKSISSIEDFNLFVFSFLFTIIKKNYMILYGEENIH